MKRLSLILAFLSLTANALADCPRSADRVICPGDTVMSNNGWTGKVLGINYFTSEAGVRWKTNTNVAVVNRAGSYKIETLALGLGCVSGYCVGDEVVSNNGWTGTIVGVNSFDHTAGVRWKTNTNGAPVNYASTHELNSLANAEFCDDYGLQHRSLAVFPKVDESLLLSSQLRFSAKRPVLK